MRRRNSFVFLFILVIFIIAAAVVFPLSTSAGGSLGGKTLKLGLDLQGGIRLSYHADLTGIDQSKWNDAISSDIAALSNRINALGVAEPVIQQHGQNGLVIELPGYSDVETARNVIGQTAILEFGEQTAADDPAVKWSADTHSGQAWKPAMGTLNGKQVPLTSAYFQRNTNVNIGANNQIVVQFQWNSDGAILSKEITNRLLQK